MTVESADDQAALVEDFGETFLYTPVAYVADHPTSSETIPIIMVFNNEYMEFNGVGGMSPALAGFSWGAPGGKVRREADSQDYYVRSVQNDGTGFYLWILEVTP